MVQEPRNDATEEWNPLPGYEGLYEVSSYARVRGLRQGNGHSGMRIRKPYIDKRGYFRLTLSKGNKKQCFYLHKLVALAFLGLTPEGLTVNHKNGQKTDNRPANLEYISNAANVRHAIATGLTDPVSRARRRSRLTEFDVVEIRALRATYPASALATMYGVKPCVIFDLLARRSWRGVR